MEVEMSERQIREGIHSIVKQLCEKHFMPEVVVPIMDGALFFASDLIRGLYPSLNPVVAPIKLTRAPRLTDPTRFQVLKHNTQFYGVAGGIKDKNVVLVDTICDSGETLRVASEVIREKHARNVTTVCLLWRGLDTSIFKPDIFAHKVSDEHKSKFFVGYGLDKEGKYRGAPFIYC